MKYGWYKLLEFLFKIQQFLIEVFKERIMDLLKKFLIFVTIIHHYIEGHPFDLGRSNIAVEPIKSAGHTLTEWSKGENKGNPEEQGPYFEGDIIISDARNGVRLPGQRWPKGIIPYEIEGKFCEF